MPTVGYMISACMILGTAVQVHRPRNRERAGGRDALPLTPALESATQDGGICQTRLTSASGIKTVPLSAGSPLPRAHAPSAGVRRRR